MSQGSLFKKTAKNSLFLRFRCRYSKVFADHRFQILFFPLGSLRKNLTFNILFTSFHKKMYRFISLGR